MQYIVRKQAETAYKSGKQTAYIAKLHKTELIKNIASCILSQKPAIIQYINTYHTSLNFTLCHSTGLQSKILSLYILTLGVTNAF